MHNFLKKIFHSKLALFITSILFCGLFIFLGVFLLTPKSQEHLPSEDIVEGYSGPADIVCTMSYGYTVMEAYVNFDNKRLYYICRQNDGVKTGYMTTNFVFLKDGIHKWSASVTHNAGSSIDSSYDLSSYITGDAVYAILGTVSWTTTFSGSGTYTSGDGYTSNVVNNHVYTIDTTPPTVWRTCDREEEVSGVTYVNSLVVSASDDLTGYYIYYNNNLSYTDFGTDGLNKNEIRFYQNGTRCYYAIDGAGNQSSKYYVTLDTEPPSKIQAKKNNTVIASGGSVNESVVFEATDATSPVEICIKNLETGQNTVVNHQTKSLSYTFSTAGKYEYYAQDIVGNRTSSSTIIIDDGKAPTFSAAPANGAFTNQNVTLTASDTYSDAAVVYNRNGGSNQSGGYGNSVTVSDEGVYNYYAHDRVENISATYSFTIDKTKPTISVSVVSPSMDRASQTVVLPVGSVATQNFYISVSDPTSNGVSSGIKSFTYKRPNQSTWIDITGKTSITIGYAEGDGVYTFKVVDNAGNEATRTVELKTDTWISDENLRQQPTPTGNTYYITNEKELAWIAWDNRVNGSTFAGKIISIEADLDMSAHYWAPLANIRSVTIEGNSHIIYGIKTLYGAGGGGSVSCNGNASFIANIHSAGNIKNLRLTNLNVQGHDSNAGLVASSGWGLLIENCFVSGTIASYGGTSAGIIARAYSDGVIRNSGFTGTIHGKQTNDVLFMSRFVGGGQFKIENCFAYGNIITSTTGAESSKVYGGLLISSQNADGSNNSNIVPTNLVGNININGTQYKSYFGNGTFDSSVWFQEAKLCGGMPLLRQFYWIASAYGTQDISLSGYTKYTV